MDQLTLRVLSLGLLAGLSLGGCKPSDPVESSNQKTAAAQSRWFKDVTPESGLHFIHAAGTNYFMPDQVGSGVTLFDCDGDGRLDIYLVQNVQSRSEVTNQLFRQREDGSFEDISKRSGLAVSGRGMGAIAGDVNNDGLADIVLTEYGATRLFQNEGMGTFREVTAASGIDNPRWAVPASFMDYDRDGFLDLVVGNYIDYDPTQVCHDQQGRQDFCAPQAFPATVTRLWRNVTRSPGADPKFEEVTVPAGLHRSPGVALALVCADFTGDHWPDIFCSDDGRPNRLFVNQRNGTFLEEAALRGLALNAMGRTAANMGVAYADVNGDALADLFVTHLTEEFHALYQQDTPGAFLDTIAQSGLQKQGWRGTGFGTVSADFDHDGWPDIGIANGLVRRANPSQNPVMAGVSSWWARYAQRAQLFRNRNGLFQDISAENSTFCGEATVGRSLALGDLNKDGALDLVLGAVGGPAKIYRNTAPERGNWLKVHLVYPQFGHRDAIGAELAIKAGGRQFWGVLQPATSYLSNHEPVLHFGFGELEVAESIEVVWPHGQREIFPPPKFNQTLVLAYGSGRLKE